MIHLSISVHPRNDNRIYSMSHIPCDMHWIFRLVHSPDSVWPVFVLLYWHISFHVYFYRILIQVYAYSCDSSYISVLRSSIFRTDFHVFFVKNHIIFLYTFDCYFFYFSKIFHTYCFNDKVPKYIHPAFRFPSSYSPNPPLTISHFQ